MLDVEAVDAASTIRLLERIEAAYSLLVTSHVFLDNARYHHAVLVQHWLAQPGRRIKLRFILRIPRKMGAHSTPSWARIPGLGQSWPTAAMGSFLRGSVKRLFDGAALSHALA